MKHHVPTLLVYLGRHVPLVLISLVWLTNLCLSNMGYWNKEQCSCDNSSAAAEWV